MKFPYIYTTIVTLPLGYHTRVMVPVSKIQERVSKNVSDYNIEVKFIAFRKGENFFEESKIINKLSSGILEFEISDQDGLCSDSGYAELTFVEKNHQPIFNSRTVMSFYTSYYHENKKSFLSDNAYKFGSPTTILQMAKIKKYIDTYPTVEIDKEKDLDETLVFINPYKRIIKAKIFTADARKIENIKISPFSVKEILLSELLMSEETKWSGHMQLTASNRIVTFNFKHSFKNKKIISDYEHLDPFRGEETYMPLTRSLRNKIGKYVRN
tara:strand:- start:8 stop:814 length:807 start_codon:yes stop_codon:yes gene_type:complete